MNIKSIPEKLDSTTIKISLILLWITIVAIPYIAMISVINREETTKKTSFEYTTSETQQAIDSQLKGSPLLTFNGGCNCPYCCSALSMSVYKN
jgi:beta-lactamase regulating signal transducer with metallopeptidase domain